MPSTLASFHFPGTYLYIESSSPQKPGDTARLNSATIKGTSRDCTVSDRFILIPTRYMLYTQV